MFEREAASRFRIVSLLGEIARDVVEQCANGLRFAADGGVWTLAK